MSGLSRCSVPRNAPVANSKTRNSYDGALSAKPGVAGSGGRPTPGGAQSISAGLLCGWMQVHPAFISWAGVTPSAFAGTAVEPAAASSVRATEASTGARTRFIVPPPSDAPAAAPHPRWLAGTPAHSGWSMGGDLPFDDGQPLRRHRAVVRLGP